MFLVLATAGDTKNGILTFKGSGQVSRTAWRVAQMVKHLNPTRVCMEQHTDARSSFGTSYIYADHLNQNGIVLTHARPPKTPDDEDVPYPPLLIEDKKPCFLDAGVPIILVIEYDLVQEAFSYFVPNTNLGDFPEGSAVIIGDAQNFSVVPSSQYVWPVLHLDPFSKTIPLLQD